MKSKEIKLPEKIKLSELGFHGAWERLLSRIGDICPQCWLMIISVSLVLLLKLMPHHEWSVLYSSFKENKLFVSMVVIFGLVAVSFVWSAGQRFDVWVFMYFNVYGKRPLWLDWIMICFTQFGNGAFSVVLALILSAFTERMLAYEIMLGTLTLWLVVEIMKVLFHRKRPFVKLLEYRIVGSRARGSSFPSGHTSQSFFLATFLFKYFHLSFFITLAVFTIALLVGITRMYLGMHFPRDVLGGAILGTAWGIFAVIINNGCYC